MRVSKTSARRWFTAVMLTGVASFFNSCDSGHSSQEEDEVLTVQQGVNCGVERWPVKTGTDADVGSVNMTPQDTTIAALTSISRPSSLPQNNRASAAELQVWRLRDITITIYKLETDSDYHVVLSDGSRTMISEIPHPDCVGASSPFLPGIQAARATFNSRYTPTPTFQTANVTGSVIGAGFFDFFHGQTGVAPNGIELHAVLGVCFGAACQIGTNPNDIVNGDFETGDLTGWTVTTGMVNVTNVGPHGGNWAAQLGSTSPFNGDSTLFQTIAVPATGINTLSFWYNPHCTDTIQYDWQDAQVQDLNGVTLINMLHACENTGTWRQVTADLTPYNGLNVNLVFTDHDDGSPADPTYYLLDDVTLTSGSGGPPSTSITSPSPGATVSGTVNVSAVGSAQPPATLSRIEIYADGALLGSGTTSPTIVAWDTTTASDGQHALTSVAYDSLGASGASSAVTVTVANGGGRELIVNGGFENGVSPWYRGGVRWPNVTTTRAHTGSSSLQCGADALPEPNGDSWADQQVTIPSNITRATLSFWYYAASTDTIQYDWQDAQVRNTSNQTLLNIFHLCDNSQVWTQRIVDLTAFRGQTVRIYFNAHGDGYGDLTTLWVDDVSLIVQ